jgi:phage/plasmid-associated DNA primase
MMDGAIKFFKDGLGETPELIISETNKYMNENDEIGNFIKEYLDDDYSKYEILDDFIDG